MDLALFEMLYMIPGFEYMVIFNWILNTVNTSVFLQILSDFGTHLSYLESLTLLILESLERPGMVLPLEN